MWDRAYILGIDGHRFVRVKALTPTMPPPSSILKGDFYSVSNL